MVLNKGKNTGNKKEKLTESLHLMVKIARRLNDNVLLVSILGDPGAVSWVNKMFVVKVYCKIETSPWALHLIEPVPEAFELPASDWPKLFFSGESVNRSGLVTLVFSYKT